MMFIHHVLIADPQCAVEDAGETNETKQIISNAEWGMLLFRCAPSVPKDPIERKRKGIEVAESSRLCSIRTTSSNAATTALTGQTGSRTRVQAQAAAFGLTSVGGFFLGGIRVTGTFPLNDLAGRLSEK